MRQSFLFKWVLQSAIFWLICFSFVSASTTNSFLYDSLKYPTSIRAIGMGNAYVGVAEESSALFINPAGLVMPGRMLNYESLDFQERSSSTFENFAIHLSPLGYGYVRNTRLNGDSSKITYYGYANRGSNGVDWGLTYKSVDVTMDHVKTAAFSADIGLLFRLTPRFNWGVVAKDVLKRDLDIQPTLVTGFSIMSKDRGIVIANDWVHYDFQNQHYLYSRLGTEFRISDGVFFRMGLDREYFSLGSTFGFGFFNLDYALKAHFQEQEDRTYYFGIKFGQTQISKELRRRYSMFKKGAFAEFSIGGNLSVGRSVVSLLNGAKMGTNDVLVLMDHASTDESCEGFIVRIGSLTQSLSTVAVVEELRRSFEKAKRLGKRVYVYLDGYASLPELYLATVADYVMMPELGTIGQLGLDFEIIKTREFFKNFGIGYDVLSSGEHKGALNPNSKDITAKDRDLIEGLVNDLYQQVLMTVKEDRDLSWDTISESFDGSLLSATKGKELGLIDGLGFWKDLKDVVAKRQPNVGRIKLEAFARDMSFGAIFPFYNRIAVIEVDGQINSGKSSSDFLYGSKSTGAEDIREIVDFIKKDASIRGVILRVNSPGGSMLASDQIYHAINELREASKRVYTSMGNVAASGGYYVALASDQIWASSATLTGSIGVISVFQNIEALNELLGIQREVIKTGPYMDMFSGNHALNDDELSLLQAFQHEKYEVFVDRVKTGRSMTQDQVAEVAQGQVFTGHDAKRLKLVDRIGSFQDAIGALANDLGIDDPELVVFRKPLSFIERLFLP